MICQNVDGFKISENFYIFDVSLTLEEATALTAAENFLEVAENSVVISTSILLTAM